MDFDVEADLWAQSEFSEVKAEPPLTVIEWRKENKPKPSIFDCDPEEQVLSKPNEGIPVSEYNIVMVRGRPIKVKHVEKPGPDEFHKKTQETIREVCGVGHSNEVTETYVKLLQRQSKNLSPPAEMMMKMGSD